jgi:hypothetical protein
MSDDLPLFFTRETVRIGALIWAGKPRLAWQQLRDFSDQFAAMIERQPGGMLDPAGPPPGVNLMDNQRYDSRPELVRAGTLDTGDPQPAVGNGQTQDLLACSRGAHAFGPVDGNGWRTCIACGQVNIAP